MPNVLGSRRVVWSRPRFVWRDEFNGAAGAPSAALWTETDSNNKLRVDGSGNLEGTGSAVVAVWGDPQVVSRRTFARRPGLTFECQVTLTSDANNCQLGFSSNYVGFFTLSRIRIDDVAYTVPAYAVGTSYRVRIILRASGALYYISTDGGRSWQVMWIGGGSGATPTVSLVGNYFAATIDYARVWQGREPAAAVTDTFTRDDSTTSLGTTATGQAWTAVAGTGGISGNAGYSASDADGDLFTVPTGDAADALIQMSTRGTLNSAVNYRVPALVFRYVDSSNYLRAYLRAGNVYLDKVDGGVVTNLGSAAQTTTDNTSYDIRAVCNGNEMRIYVGSADRISYTLSGGDTKYAAYTTVGVQLLKGGSPATAASWDNLVVHGGIP